MTDWTIPQDWDRYSAADHALWDRLYTRQRDMLQNRAATAFLDGLDALQLSESGIPEFDELSRRLHDLTGWSVVAVPGLVPDEAFFENLAERRFVAGRFIRSEGESDYLQEPDIFHDVFGHVPLLTNPVFADYMEAYGRGGLRASKHGAIENLARLYWYTVEFGLLRENGGLRLYGAGILSSFGESIHALEDPRPPRIAFDLRRVMRTEYRIDTFQPNYFVIDSFDDLLEQTVNADFGPLYVELASASVISAGDVVATDRLLDQP